jgi:hypothetical protein
MKRITVLRILFFACIIIVISSVERLGWPLVIVLSFLIYMVSRSIKKEEKESKKLPSYRLELLIEPHWCDILKRILPGLEKGEEFHIIKLLRATNKYTEIELAKNYYEFVIFNHKNTIGQVWNAEKRSFVENVELRLRMFPWENEDEVLKKINDLSTNDEELKKLISKQNMKENLIKLFCSHDYFDKEGDFFRIRLWLGEIVANFATIGPIRDIVDGKELASVPLYDVIIPFLYEVNKQTISGAMKGVKTFPKSICELFNKKEITYFDKNKEHDILYHSKWAFSGDLEERLDKKWAKKVGIELYSNEVTYHWFSTRYFSVGVQVEFHND